MAESADEPSPARNLRARVHERRSESISDSLTSIMMWSQAPQVVEGAMEAAQFPLLGDDQAFLMFQELIRRGPSNPSQLAEALHTGRSNISKIIGRLEAAGIVARSTDSVDTRSVVVSLSEAGQTLADRLIATGMGFFRTLLSEWEDRDLDDLERLLRRLSAEIDTLTTIRSS